MNCPVLLQCPDEFIPNTKVVRNTSTTSDTPPLRLSGTHETPGLSFSPLRTPCPVVTPDPAIHRQMNSCSELSSSYHVSSSIIIHCHALHCFYDCYVFTVSPPPPLISGRPPCFPPLQPYRVPLIHPRPYPHPPASKPTEPIPP